MKPWGKGFLRLLSSYPRILPAWGSILRGRRPFLSVEITRECPLRCPGCYAFQPEHLGTTGPLRDLTDLKGDALVAGVLGLVRHFRPVHVSIVGGEPLVRWRELDILLPRLADMGVEVQLVTSAVRPIPTGWTNIPNLELVVSVDGLQPEHDRRRSPATYDRILQHIAGHKIVVHCTITRTQLQRSGPGYLEEFASFWTTREEVQKIWFSLYTPQEGEQSEERLSAQDRASVVKELARLRGCFPKVELLNLAVSGYLDPPSSPQECIFAQTTTCISADLTTRITPCQFGGRPVCAECGCVGSAIFTSIGKHRLGALVPLSDLFVASKRTGEMFSRFRRAVHF